ncbi:MAG: protein O-mannosyl-transferase family [Blastocatellia bacterium]
MTAAAATFNPLRSVKVRSVCAAAVFATSLALYARTLAPTVTLVDSGELILAASTLGVAHPPGFPLYVLLAHVATMPPFGSVAARVNFASAFFAALAASMLVLVVAELLLTLPPVRAQKKKARGRAGRNKKAGKVPPNPSPAMSEEVNQYLRWMTALAPCLTAGLLFAFSRTLWAYATIAEVYTLNAFLILMVFFLMFRWRRRMIDRQDRPAETDSRRGGAQPPDERKNSSENLRGPASAQAKPRGNPPLRGPYRLLYAASFAFGLALCVHHATVGVNILALAALVYFTDGLRFFSSKRLIYAAAFAIAGLSVYLFLPLAASRSPIMNWGDPRTPERFWRHVTGRQYQVFLSPSLNTMVGQLGPFFRLAAREFNPWWLPAAVALAAMGFAALFRRDRTAFWFLALVMIGDLAYALNYEIAEDKDAYYLPTFIAMAVAAGVGADWLVRPARFRWLPVNLTRAVAVCLVVVIPLTAFASNLPYNDRSRYYIARDYADNILSTVEPNGMLLTLDWQVYSPLLYLQRVEGRRTDVVAIDLLQLRRSWYFDYLEREYPEMMGKARDKVGAFLEDLRHWEEDAELYQRDLALNQRINSRFYEMILSFVSNHLQSAPVYITEDVATNFQGQDSELTKSLSSAYGPFVPQGLVFQLPTDSKFHEPARPALVTRGLFDGAIKLEDDDVAMIKVRPVYLRMLVNRGRYLAAYGRHEEAIEAFEQALALDPGFKYAQQSMSESAAALRKGESNKSGGE